MASLVQYSLLGTVLSRPCTLSWPNYSTMQVIHVNWLRHLPADLAPLPTLHDSEGPCLEVLELVASAAAHLRLCPSSCPSSSSSNQRKILPKTRRADSDGMFPILY